MRPNRGKRHVAYAQPVSFVLQLQLNHRASVSQVTTVLLGLPLVSQNGAPWVPTTQREVAPAFTRAFHAQQETSAPGLLDFQAIVQLVHFVLNFRGIHSSVQSGHLVHQADLFASPIARHAC